MGLEDLARQLGRACMPGYDLEVLRKAVVTGEVLPRSEVLRIVLTPLVRGVLVGAGIGYAAASGRDPWLYVELGGYVGLAADIVNCGN